jgi:hypothetical protein
MHYLIATKKFIGKPINYYNKLIPLFFANKLDIAIPYTYLFGSLVESEIIYQSK